MDIQKVRQAFGIESPATHEQGRSADMLADCPLWQAKLVCHMHTEGRCNHNPAGCNLAVGMRAYIEEHFTRKDEHEAS